MANLKFLVEIKDPDDYLKIIVIENPMQFLITILRYSKFNVVVNQIFDPLKRVTK